MMNTPLSPSGQLARYFVAGPLVLAVALGISGARAQSGGPVGPPAAARAAGALPLTILDKDGQTRLALAGPADYYLDAVSSMPAQLAQLPQTAIASVRVLKAEQARKILGSTQAAYIITTKAQQNAPAVLVFNKQVEAMVPSWIGFDDALDPVVHDPNQQLTNPAGQAARTSVSAALPGQAPPTLRATPPARVATPTKPAARAPGLGQAYYRYGQPTPVVYLDGQRYSGDINDVGPKNIANVSMFKGEEARRRFGAEANEAVIVVTTIANQDNAEVRAFNERVGAGVEKPAAPAATPASAAGGVPYLAAPALAYITQHYPAARLLGVTEVPAPDGGPTRYQAQVVIGRRPAYLLFDGAGQFISDSYTSYLK